MPYITIRGVKQEKLLVMETKIGDIVAEVLNSSKDHVKVFLSPLVEIKNGEIVETSPSLDIYWMPRPQEICDTMATKLTEYFHSEGFPTLEVTFTEFEGRLFYINAKNFA